MAVRKRSLMWNYFDISSEERRFAVCLLCNAKISRGGEGKKAGTYSMKNHLKTKHRNEFQALSQDLPTVPNMPSAIPEISLSSVPIRQLNIQQSFKSQFVRNVNDLTTKKYDYLIAEMIALDNESVSMLERTGFTRLLRQALPQYNIPNSTHITQNIIPDIYDRILQKIKMNISGAEAISVTSDVWTSSQDNAKGLTLTAHWVTTDFKFEKAVLTMKTISGSHIGDITARELNSISDHWDIGQSKIHLLIHNNDMMENLVKEEYKSSECFLHSLQRAINEAIDSQPELTTIMETSRMLVEHFNNSDLAQQLLLSIQRELNLPEHQLVQDTSDRCNSTYYMLERLLEQKGAISLFASDENALTNLMPEQWCFMEQYIVLLKPFEEITRVVSSGLSYISEVIPHLATLISFLGKNGTESTTPDLSHMKAVLKIKLEDYLSSLTQNYNYLISTFLDPRFKTSCLGTNGAERTRQTIQFELIKKTYDDSSSLSLTLPKKIKTEEPGSVAQAHWDCYVEVVDKIDHGLPQEQDPKSISYEIDNYLEGNLIDSHSDPLSWWSTNAAQYPNITKLVRKYLSSPCSSVFNESLYSEAGLGYEEMKCRLLPLREEKMVFIRNNLPLVQYEY